MKLIELTQGRVAIVDDEDFEWLSKWKWYFCRYGKSYYARRDEGSCTNRRRFYMHTVIMKRHRHWKQNSQVDHINNCGCDNQKENLRLATHSSQKANEQRRINNTSGVTGVYWCESQSRWHAKIGVNRKTMYLGSFIDKKDAIAVRRQAEIKYFGEYRHDPKQLCPLWKTGQCPDCAERAKELGFHQS